MLRTGKSPDAIILKPRAGGFRVHWVQRPAPSKRIVVLLHGFRIEADQAQEEFEVFLNLLSRIAPDLSRDAITMSWPGQVGGIANHRYEEAVAKARGDVAKALCEFILQESEVREKIVFVCHSLGCRLMVEAISQLHATHGDAALKKLSVFLMAAAVPVDFVDREPFRKALDACHHRDILYSSHDRVLRWAFPLGERRVSGSETRRAEAVGLNGGPAKLWRKSSRMGGFDHGDYWCNDQVAYRIGLALNEAQQRPLNRRLSPKRWLRGRMLGARVMANFARVGWMRG